MSRSPGTRGPGELARDPRSVPKVVHEWQERDRASSLTPTERATVQETEALRTLVVELAFLAPGSRDMLTAFALLGRTYADKGGSPTLVSYTVDHLCEALESALSEKRLTPPWKQAARTATLEGYVQAHIESVERRERASWEYPGCAVFLGNQTAAIASGFSEDDEDACDAWARRVALGAARDGIRKAFVVQDSSRGRLLAAAFRCAGIEVLSRS